jgi:DNA-binding MarR family transcriptional regulator
MRTFSRGRARAERVVRADRGLEFLRVLWALDHALETHSRRMKQALGVTGRERIVVRLIGSMPRASAGDVARILHLDPSSLTAVLKRLVRRGLVRRSTHPDDSRRAVLELTRRGAAVNALRTGTVEAQVKKVVARASPREVEAAAALLRGLIDSLES